MKTYIVSMYLKNLRKSYWVGLATRCLLGFFFLLKDVFNKSTTLTSISQGIYDIHRRSNISLHNPITHLAWIGVFCTGNSLNTWNPDSSFVLIFIFIRVTITTIKGIYLENTNWQWPAGQARRYCYQIYWQKSAFGFFSKV